MHLRTSEYHWKGIDLLCHAPAASHGLVVEQLYGPHLAEKEKDKKIHLFIRAVGYEHTDVCYLGVILTQQLRRKSIHGPKNETTWTSTHIYFTYLKCYFTWHIPHGIVSNSKLSVETARDGSVTTEHSLSCTVGPCRTCQATTSHLHALSLLFGIGEHCKILYRVTVPVLAWQRLRLPSSYRILGRQI